MTITTQSLLSNFELHQSFNQILDYPFAFDCYRFTGAIAEEEEEEDHFLIHCSKSITDSTSS